MTVYTHHDSLMVESFEWVGGITVSNNCQPGTSRSDRIKEVRKGDDLGQ
jgi:hypothetical protein